MNCAALHRTLGHRVSQVRSLSMDTWLEAQLKLMALGGNKKLRDFFEKYDLHEEEINNKYNSCAAEWYRGQLRSLGDGVPFNETEPSYEEGK